jgi:hypothetical protein
VLPSVKQKRKPLDQKAIKWTVQIGVCRRTAVVETEGRPYLRRALSIISDSSPSLVSSEELTPC